MLSAVTFLLTDMNRSELQDQLIQQIIDDMDIKTMAALLYDMMDESYDNYSEKELIAEVEEYYPHILEESNTNWVSRGCASRTTYTQNRHRGQNRVL